MTFLEIVATFQEPITLALAWICIAVVTVASVLIGTMMRRATRKQNNDRCAGAGWEIIRSTAGIVGALTLTGVAIAFIATLVKAITTIGG